MYNDFEVIKLDRLRDYVTNMGRSVIAYACQTAILSMRNRVTVGKNIDGSLFRPYSTKKMYIDSPYIGLSQTYKGGYAEYKRVLGYSGVNLMVTGQMLNGIIYQSNDFFGKVYPATDEIEDKIIKNERLGRSFFGLAENETNEMFESIVKKVQGEINAILA